MALDRATWEAFYAARKEADGATTGPAARLVKRLRDKLLLDNLGLAKKFGVNYARACSVDGFKDADDAIQAATVGLLKAIDRFDIGQGNQFSTYATFWIRKELQDQRLSEEAFKTRPGERMPLAIAIRLKDFFARTGCEAEPKDLGMYKDVPVTQEMLDAWRTVPITQSFESPLGGERKAGFSREEVVADVFAHADARPGLKIGDGVSDPTPCIEEQIETRETTSELIEELEDVLTPSERMVMTRSLFEDMTEADIARERGTSRQAVNLLAQRAIGKLREARAKK